MDRSGRLSAETIKFFYRDVKQCLKSSNYDAPNEVFSTYLGGSGSIIVAVVLLLLVVLLEVVGLSILVRI